MGTALDRLKKLVGIRTGTEEQPKGLLHAVATHNQQLKEAYEMTDGSLYKTKLGKPEKNTKSVYQRLKNKSKHQ